jgi:hypothetical protein
MGDMDDVMTQTRAVLATTVNRWQTLIQALPVEMLTRPAAPGEWAPLDCLRHLVDTERDVFPVRVRAFLDGRDIVAFDPEAPRSAAAEQMPAQLVADFAARRAASLVALEDVTATDLTRTARHSEQGVVTLGEMLNEWAAHDLNHTVQAERALMQPFIARCGSWRGAFADHDLAREA